MKPDPARFPDLFRTHRRRWGTVEVTFTFELREPPPELVGNVRMVPFVGSDVVVVVSEHDGPMIVGGTLEPGETPRQAIERELLEEAGAALRSFHPLGCARFQSDAPVPYRDHLPHPEWYWLIGTGDVEVIGPPAQPPGGERIVSVELHAPEAAAALYAAGGDGWAADLVRLAAQLRVSARPPHT